MQAIKTLYRAVVMLATLAIVGMGWSLYGPSNEQLQPLLQQAAAMADRWLGSGEDASEGSPSVVELPVLSQVVPLEPDSLETRFAQLKQRGAEDLKLEPWGASGALYRFSCQAASADQSLFRRHFESVAAEPLAAVEQVVFEIDAWQSEPGRPRPGPVGDNSATGVGDNSATGVGDNSAR